MKTRPRRPVGFDYSRPQREVFKKALEQFRNASEVGRVLLDKKKVASPRGGPYNGNTISAWARMDTKAPPEVVYALAQLCKVSIDQILGIAPTQNDIFRGLSETTERIAKNVEEALKRLPPS